MNTFCYIPILVAYGLATYRLSIMIASDKGPYFVFSKLRSWLKREAHHNKPLRDSKVHVGIACPLCTSVWVALPVAVFVYFHRRWPDWLATTGDVFLGAMALSAISILLGRLLPPK